MPHQKHTANAGWYTLPFTKGHAHNWPYSLQNAPVKFTPAQLELIFSRKLLVLLGQEDVGMKYLRVEPGMHTHIIAHDVRQIYVHKCIFIHAYVHICMYIYTHIYIYT